MPRIRKRSTDKGNWKKENLEDSLKAIDEGMSIRGAQKSFRIPFSTLQERMKTGNISPPKLGGKTVCTPEQERQMVKTIIDLAQVFYGLTPLQIRLAAYRFAEDNNIPHTFNKEMKCAGIDWFRSFIKRNPTISIRKPEATSMNRVLAFNKSDVQEFFDNLEVINQRYNFPAERIWNMDETGISNVQQPEKIVAEKGQKRIGAITSGERGKNVTLICAMSAAGSFVPPMFIFPRKRMASKLCKNGPAGAVYHCSHNGWSNSELFLVWLRHFQQHLKCSVEDPVLLILDNHISHISFDAFNFCREEGIVMLSLVPHCCRRLQPLDVSFFGPFKKAYRRECDLFMKKKALQQIKHSDLAEIVSQAYGSVASIKKGCSGFASTGIYPFRRDIFSEKDFMAADQLQRSFTIPAGNVTDIDSMPILVVDSTVITSSEHSIISPISRNCTTEELVIPLLNTNCQVEQELPTSTSTRPPTEVLATPPTEDQPPIEDLAMPPTEDQSFIEDLTMPPTKDLATPLNSKLSTSEDIVRPSTRSRFIAKASTLSAASRISTFEDLVTPLTDKKRTAKALAPTNTQTTLRKKQKSVILIDSPMKKQLEERQKRLEDKQRKEQEKLNKFKTKLELTDLPQNRIIKKEKQDPPIKNQVEKKQRKRKSKIEPTNVPKIKKIRKEKQYPSTKNQVEKKQLRKPKSKIEATNVLEIKEIKQVKVDPLIETKDLEKQAMGKKKIQNTHHLRLRKR